MQRAALKRRKSLREYHEDKLKREQRFQKTAIPSKATPLKSRKQMKRVSASRERQNRQYLAQREVLLRRCPICAACLTRGISPAPSAQVHHSRGRLKGLLLDERFWIAVCAECHEWIHEHPNAARALGLLAPIAQWNTKPID